MVSLGSWSYGIAVLFRITPVGDWGGCKFHYDHMPLREKKIFLVSCDTPKPTSVGICSDCLYCATEIFPIIPNPIAIPLIEIPNLCIR